MRTTLYGHEENGKFDFLRLCLGITVGLSYAYHLFDEMLQYLSLFCNVERVMLCFFCSYHTLELNKQMGFFIFYFYFLILILIFLYLIFFFNGTCFENSKLAY